MKLQNYFRAGWLLLSLLLTNIHINAQIPVIQWEKTYGGEANDEGRKIIRTFNGGYVMAGYTTSSLGDVTDYHAGGDMWVVSTDSAGNILWSHAYGGSIIEDAHDIKQTADSGFIIAGYTMSTDGDVTSCHGGLDVWVIKVDATGNMQWQKSYGGTGNEEANAIYPTADGGSILTGWTTSYDGDISEHHGEIWVVKLNDTGRIEWEKTYGGTSNAEVAYDIIQATDGNYVFGGYTKSVDMDVTSNHGFIDAWVVKINDTGSIIWQKTYGGTNAESLNSLRQTPDGGYVFAASTNSSDGQVTGYHGGSFDGLGDFWVVKIDDTGALQWQKTYGGSKDDVPKAIVTTTDGGYILTGYTDSHNGDVSYKRDTTDIWTIKIDHNGTIEWEKTSGGADVEIGNSILQIATNTYMVAGFTKSANDDVTLNHGGSDFWMINLEQVPTAINIPSQSSIAAVYPTVITNGSVYADLANGFENAHITLTSITGVSVPVSYGSGIRKTIHIGSTTPGIYVLKIADNKHVGFYKLIVSN